ncbi:MAG: ScyD/ScyE family protein [Actinomycetes bacterium]
MRLIVATTVAAAAGFALVGTTGANAATAGTSAGWSQAVAEMRAAISHFHGSVTPDMPQRPADVTVLASGLNNPRGVAVAQDGTVYVAIAGRGGRQACFGSPGQKECGGYTSMVERLLPGESTLRPFVRNFVSIAGPDGSFATGIDGVAANPHGGADFVETSANMPTGIAKADAQFGRLWYRPRHHHYTELGNIQQFEFDHDPDGQGPDSDPYGVADAGAYQVVADAAGNDLLKVQGGDVSLLAVLPQITYTDNHGRTQSLDPVPTCVTQGPDGNFYVGELGGNGKVRKASIWRVTPGGSATQLYTGFTAIDGIAFDPQGNLYVTELVKHGFGQAGQGDFAGALIRIRPNGNRVELAKGQLALPGGLGIGPDGAIYVTTYSLFPGAGQLVRVTPTG